MPVYVYTHADHSWEEVRPMSQSSWEAECPRCLGQKGVRDLRAELPTPHVFKEYVDIHATGKPVRIASREQKNALLKSQGLVELGNEPMKGMESEMLNRKTFILPPIVRGKGATLDSSRAASASGTSG